jgi:TPR repeat protein
MVFSLNFTCPICLEDVNSTGRMLCCGQGICNECNRKCEVASKSCPMCRAPNDVTGDEYMARIFRLKDKSDPVSQNLIGQAYLRGEYGLKKDIKRAMEYLQISNEQCYALALEHGRRLPEGFGIIRIRGHIGA